MVDLLKAILDGILVVIQGINHIGGMLLDPGEGSAIALTWIFGPLLAGAGVQKIKRLLVSYGLDPHDGFLETLGFFSCALICFMMLHGLWNVTPRLVVVHVFLISWCHMVLFNTWMNFLRKYCPGLFKAFRSKRRAGDAALIASNTEKPFDPNSTVSPYSADPDVSNEYDARLIRKELDHRD